MCFVDLDYLLKFILTFANVHRKLLQAQKEEERRRKEAEEVLRQREAYIKVKKENALRMAMLRETQKVLEGKNYGLIKLL